MAINKKLIHFKTKANFNTQLEAGNILDTSIVYIQDAKEIYTHGTTYGTCLSEEQIETIIANSDTIADVLSQISTLETSISTNLNNAKSYTDQKIADLVGQAPEALNTVYELAQAMSDNQTAIDTLEQAIANKVDKVTGKGLSTNDYTTAEKNKLSGIASGAEVNVQSDWNVTDTGNDAYIKNKPSSLPARVPTFYSIISFSKEPLILIRYNPLSISLMFIVALFMLEMRVSFTQRPVKS